MSEAVEAGSLKAHARAVAERIGENQEFADFDFAIFYSTLAAIPIAKYGARGYRLAMVEAGSMYQLASQIAQSVSLQNRVWGGLDDEGLSIALGIDPRAVWPLVCQIFGRRGQ